MRVVFCWFWITYTYMSSACACKRRNGRQHSCVGTKSSFRISDVKNNDSCFLSIKHIYFERKLDLNLLQNTKVCFPSRRHLEGLWGCVRAVQHFFCLNAFPYLYNIDRNILLLFASNLAP